MTENQKNIYNAYLKSMREAQNKPWRARKDFSNFDETKKRHIEVIESIVCNKNINLHQFFKAPYVVWRDSQNIPLDFYKGFKALKAYRLYIHKILNTEYESPECQTMISEGFDHIEKKCKSRGIKDLKDYVEWVNIYPEFLLDLKEGNICYYNIFGLDGAEEFLIKFNKEEIEFLIEDFYEVLNSLRVNYFRSKIIQNTIKANIKNIKEKL